MCRLPENIRNKTCLLESEDTRWEEVISLTLNISKARITSYNVCYTKLLRPGSSTYPVTVILADLSEKIRPGMPANVTFTFEKEEKRNNFV